MAVFSGRYILCTGVQPHPSSAWISGFTQLAIRASRAAAHKLSFMRGPPLSERHYLAALFYPRLSAAAMLRRIKGEMVEP